MTDAERRLWTAGATDGVATNPQMKQLNAPVENVNDGLGINSNGTGALFRTDSSTTNTDMLATNIYSLTLALYDHVGSNTTLVSTAKGIQIDIKLRKQVISNIQSEDYLSARVDMRNK